MPKRLSQDQPGFSVQRNAQTMRLRLHGIWTVAQAHEAEAASLAIQAAGDGAAHAAGAVGQPLVLDLGQIARMDTAGAWLIDRARQWLVARGLEVEIVNASADQTLLFNQAHFRTFEPSPRQGSRFIGFLADIGAGVAEAGRDFFGGMTFLGSVVVALLALFWKPQKFRLTSLVYHIESFAFRSVPIIALINFLVGGIVAQQGIFQLQRFGAAAFAVDLIGILVLRELAVLLTSIMVAGRTGSAITAEIGSMKMREEIDALNVMGLDPVEVLIVPRLLALIITLPLLTFVADMAAIFGGVLVGWSYGGLSPEVFMTRLQSAISIHTFLVGIIKAPFMALVIGLIATVEGLAVKGSAESLGRQVTASVVKSIFMVIVVDGLFAMFFTAIKY